MVRQRYPSSSLTAHFQKSNRPTDTFLTFLQSVKIGKDPKYPPSFKVKVPVFNDGTAFVPQVNIFIDRKPVAISVSFFIVTYF
jgi:hypothetical protein